MAWKQILLEDDLDAHEAIADVHTDVKVRTKEVDEAAIADGRVLVYRTASGKLEYETPSGGGGDDHAPVGALYPGVLSTGLKPPQVPYKGNGFTATELYCRASVAPQTTDIVVQIRRNGALLGTVTITAANQTGSTVINQAISDNDYFDINITGVGTTPNEGSDLVWLVAP